jgi:hypothetical protein
MNLVVLIGLSICIYFGLYGKMEGGHGEEEEEEDAAAYMEEKSVDDVPLNKELENIIEMSQEDYETSRGSIYDLKPLGNRDSMRKDDPFAQRKPSRSNSRFASRAMSKYKPSMNLEAIAQIDESEFDDENDEAGIEIKEHDTIGRDSLRSGQSSRMHSIRSANSNRANMPRTDTI